MMFKKFAMLEHLQQLLQIYSENPEMLDVTKNNAVFFDDFSSSSRFQAKFGQSPLAIGSEEGKEPRLDGIRNATLPKFEAFVGSLGEAEAAFATLFHNICTDQYNDEFMKLAEGDVTRVGERLELDKFLRCDVPITGSIWIVLEGPAKAKHSHQDTASLWQRLPGSRECHCHR